MAMNPGLDRAANNQEVRPQDDLFRHVNGVWLDTTDIPEDKAIFGAFHMLADDSELAVREILEEAAENPRPGVSQQIGDLYSSFLAEDRIEKLGAEPLQGDLAKVAAVGSVAELFRLVGEIEREPIGGFWGSYVDNDAGNPERYLVHLLQGGIGLPDRDYYFDEKYEDIRKAYLPHLTRMFSLAGLSDAQQRARSVYDFECKLAAHHWNRVESRDAEKTYNLHSLQELKKLAPGIAWDEYLSGINFRTNLLDFTVVMMPSFFEGLSSLATEENLSAMKNALIVDVIRAYAPYLSADFVAERFEFYVKKLTGQPVNRPRWKRAVTLVEGSLGEAVGQIYVEKHFPPAAKQRMDELVGYLIRAYEQSIRSLSWMTDKTKEKALIKLKKFTPKIGYPVRWKDYSSIVIAKDDLIQNVKNVSRWQFDYHSGKIGSPIDRDEWHMTPQTVNAYYNPGLNEIVFPAAILQPPFFSPEADDAVNFGGIGAVIGHEIGHGFDDQGSKYDGDGKLVSWWTKEDREAFETRTKSLIDQYSALTPAQLGEEHKVNGELTIGENIGDLGGLGIAWKAYLLSLAGKEPPVIDGLTGAQRFIMAWAQSWRTKGRDEIVIQRLAVDPHSPPEFRANQVVKNLDVFHQAFEVGPGDAMWLDERERVVIW
jgi:putative endopeptidase